MARRRHSRQHDHGHERGQAQAHGHADGQGPDHEHGQAHEHDPGDTPDVGHGGEEALEADERAELEREFRKRMAISQVRQYGDPALRMRAAEVEKFDGELRTLAERMTALMHEADGIGLAATQLGILRRLFVCSLDDEDTAIVNPVLAKTGTEMGTDEEGCLSLPDVRVTVERPVAVTLEGRGLDGEPLILVLEGFSARVVQHELDHLEGTLIIDRTDPESRREALRVLRPRLALQR